MHLQASTPGQVIDRLTLTEEDLQGVDPQTLGCTKCKSFCSMARVYIWQGKYASFCPKKPGSMDVINRHNARTHVAPKACPPPGVNA